MTTTVYTITVGDTLLYGTADKAEAYDKLSLYRAAGVPVTLNSVNTADVRTRQREDTPAPAPRLGVDVTPVGV